MKLTLAAFVATALAASASPAAACGFFACANEAVASDAYPPSLPVLSPNVQEQVDARGGRGLSLAGFYNDPSVEMARAYAAQAGYAEAAPEPWTGGGYGWRRHHGPHVIVGPYGRRASRERGRWIY